MVDISTLSAAVVGTGFIAGVHIDALRRLGVDVRGVVGSSAERAALGAAELGVGYAYASFEEMLLDTAVDVVHITSPNDSHATQAEAALRAGKHVVCEKPLAMTSKETARLRELAEETGLVAAVNFNLRFYPHVREMRERISSDSTGTPYLVVGSYLQDWLLKDTDWNWRADSARGGELRAVGDVGSHWFDLASFVTGRRIVEVMAELATFVPVRRKPVGPVESFSGGAGGETVDVASSSEDAAVIMIRFEGGALGTVTVSQVSAGRKNAVSIEVNAATDSVAWCGERPDELWIGHRSAPNEILLRDPALLTLEAGLLARTPGGHAEGFENAFLGLYRAVYGDIARGRPSPDAAYATFADGHDEMLILDAVASSARTGRWTAVRRIPEHTRTRRSEE
ncbi:MAG: oxidoreductase domain protein [Subtercola sp.]|nr:oxidoreductase domain protein [Subtercola sp.]